MCGFEKNIGILLFYGFYVLRNGKCGVLLHRKGNTDARTGMELRVAGWCFEISRKIGIE